MITLNGLMEKLGKQCLKKQIHEIPVEYHGANLVVDETEPQNGMLFICTTRRLAEKLCNFSLCGCLIIPDDENCVPPENSLCEWVQWDEPIRQEVLLYRVQSVFAGLFSRNHAAELLYECLLKDKSVKTFLRKICPIIGNPICFHDEAYNLIAAESQGRYVDDPMWQSSLEWGKCTPESILYLRESKLSEKMEMTNKPALWDDGVAKKMPRIAQKVISPTGELLGFIAVYQAFRTFNADDMEMINDIAKALAILEQNNRPYRMNTHQTDHLISSLLDGIYMDKVTLNKRIIELDWKPCAFYQIGYIKLSDKPGTVHQIEYIRALLKKSHTGMHPVRKQNDLYILLCSDTLQQKSEIMEKITHIMADQCLIMGISSEFFSLEYLAEHAKNAVTALELGHTYDEKNRIYLYRDMLIYHLFRQIKPDKLKSFYYSSSYAALLHYDQTKGTNYCETLLSCILNMSSHSKTAEELFIHKNTLLYRISRIRAICGVDASNGNDVFDFYMGYKLAKYLRDKDTIT